MTPLEKARMDALEAEVTRFRALEAERAWLAEEERRQAFRAAHERWREAYYGPRVLPTLASPKDCVAIDRAVQGFRAPSRGPMPFVLPELRAA